MIKRIHLHALLYKKPLIIPLPFSDEILSSWFVRIAYANNMHPHCFINNYFGTHNRGLFKNCFDANLGDELTNLFKKTLGEYFSYEELTLKSYEGILRESTFRDLHRAYIGTMQFCPKCLREEIPYYRKSWHLHLVTVCEKHQCFLYNACPQCHKSLALLRMYHDALNYTFCSYCGYDLKKAPIKKIGNKYTFGILANQQLAKMIENGYIQLGESVVYSFCFVDTITQLSKLILLRRNFAFIHKHPLFKLLENRLKSSLSSKQSTHLQLTIAEKYALFGLIMYLFEDYPNHFSQFITMNHLTHWDMMKDIRYKAFWYENLVNNITPRYIAFGSMVADAEVNNAIVYLRKQNILITKANLQRLFDNRGFFTRYKITQKN